MAERNLAVVEGATAIVHEDMFSDKRVDLIRNTVAKGAPDETFLAFLDIAKRRNLDPLAKQISLIKFGGQFTIITTIDGYRAIAEQTGQYAGSDAPVFTFTSEVTRDGKAKPDTCTVTVHKLIQGNTYPFSAMVYFEEYDTGNGNWSKMPRTMLAKVAESHALRKAFPAVMSGMYEESEMDQAIESTARVVNQSTGEMHEEPARQQPRPTAAIAPPNGRAEWEAASRRFHAVLGKYSATEPMKRALIRKGEVESGSAKDMTVQQLIDAADFLESRKDPKAYLASLLESPAPVEVIEDVDMETGEIAAPGTPGNFQSELIDMPETAHAGYGDA